MREALGAGDCEEIERGVGARGRSVVRTRRPAHAPAAQVYAHAGLCVRARAHMPSAGGEFASSCLSPSLSQNLANFHP